MNISHTFLHKLISNEKCKMQWNCSICSLPPKKYRNFIQNIMAGELQILDEQMFTYYETPVIDIICSQEKFVFKTKGIEVPITKVMHNRQESNGHIFFIVLWANSLNKKEIHIVETINMIFPSTEGCVLYIQNIEGRIG